MHGHTLTSAFLCGSTLNLEARDPRQSPASLAPGRGEVWFEDITGVRGTPMFISALTTQCLTGRVNSGEVMRGQRILARLSVPKHHTLRCMPPGCTILSPNHPITPPGPSVQQCVGQHISQWVQPSGNHGHAQLHERRPHSSGVPCQTGRDDIQKDLLFICKRPFLFPSPCHNPCLSLTTSDSPPTCSLKEEAMIMAKLVNITSLMPRKPLVCSLRAVSG